MGDCGNLYMRPAGVETKTALYTANEAEWKKIIQFKCRYTEVSLKWKISAEIWYKCCMKRKFSRRISFLLSAVRFSIHLSTKKSMSMSTSTTCPVFKGKSCKNSFCNKWANEAFLKLCMLRVKSKMVIIDSASPFYRNWAKLKINQTF